MSDSNDFTAATEPGDSHNTIGGEHQATDLFLSLTPERVLEAVEAAGLATRPVCYPLNSFENRVYEVELADRSRVVAKFYRPGRWTKEQILEEHRFLTELDDDELPVCPVEAFPDGETVRQMGNIFYCLFERKAGRAIDELTEEQAERLGMLIGRIHSVGARSDAPSRLPIDSDHFIRPALAWLEDHGTLPEPIRDRYLATASEIADRLDRLMTGVALQRVHGDLHLGNILMRDGVLRLLDFDDMVIGPPVQDIWLATPGNDQWARAQRERLLEGYERFRDFDRSTLLLIEPLRGLRMIHFATWLARRWHDPAFPATWPQFGQETFWYDETSALEEQLQTIRRDDTSTAAPVNDEPVLDNSDYFWDWEEN